MTVLMSLLTLAIFLYFWENCTKCSLFPATAAKILTFFCCLSVVLRLCVVVCGGVRWCAVVCGGVRWCAMVCGGVRWCAVVCGGVRWCVLTI